MSARGKKALIKTLDLYNGNYGGILQNYALQRVLDGLGYEAWTDARRHPSLRHRVKHAAKPAVRRLVPASRLPVRLAHDAAQAELMEFVRTRIRTTSVRRGRKVRSSVLDGFDALVTGSDQVWRHAYTDVSDNLFDFAEGSTATRIAYAGSFGTDNLDEYPPEMLARSRELAQKLTAVSVRETSAVQLCASAWGVDATHVLDPTMLLPASDYDALIDERPAHPRASPYLFEYVLDSSPASRELTQEVADDLGLEVRHGLPREPDTYAEAKRSPETYAKPAVREWLRGFRDAEFVVTDSFHGTVFSIVFERPFVSVPNSTRGAERFHSMLSMLGLEDRLLLDGARPDGRMSTPPDWGPVRERLAAERATSMAFLRSALGLTSPVVTGHDEGSDQP